MNHFQSIRVVTSIQFNKICVLGSCLSCSKQVGADVRSDFIAGSGGIAIDAFEQFVQYTIFILLLLLAGWVSKEALVRLIDADHDDYYLIFARIFRVSVLCFVVIYAVT